MWGVRLNVVWVRFLVMRENDSAKNTEVQTKICTQTHQITLVRCFKRQERIQIY